LKKFERSVLLRLPVPVEDGLRFSLSRGEDARECERVKFCLPTIRNGLFDPKAPV